MVQHARYVADMAGYLSSAKGKVIVLRAIKGRPDAA
jgi:hypothetical protein